MPKEIKPGMFTAERSDEERKEAFTLKSRREKESSNSLESEEE